MYTLSKTERLCSKILIEELLASELSFIKYPFRVVYKISSIPGTHPARIAVSVGKKKFKRAVKRNRVKRLAREAFRLNKEILYNEIQEGKTIDILLIYLDNTIPTFAKTEKAVKAILQKIVARYSSEINQE